MPEAYSIGCDLKNCNVEIGISYLDIPSHTCKKGAKDGRTAKTRKKQNPHKAMPDYNHSPLSDNNACGSPDIGNGKCPERRHRLLS